MKTYFSTQTKTHTHTAAWLTAEHLKPKQMTFDAMNADAFWQPCTEILSEHVGNLFQTAFQTDAVSPSLDCKFCTEMIETMWTMNIAEILAWLKCQTFELPMGFLVNFWWCDDDVQHFNTFQKNSIRPRHKETKIISKNNPFYCLYNAAPVLISSLAMICRIFLCYPLGFISRIEKYHKYLPQLCNAKHVQDKKKTYWKIVSRHILIAQWWQRPLLHFHTEIMKISESLIIISRITIPTVLKWFHSILKNMKFTFTALALFKCGLIQYLLFVDFEFGTNNSRT